MVSSEYEIPVFYPTLDEFRDFSAFIASIEARGAHRIGLAKIVPPKEWKARQLGYKHKQIDEQMVENPIKQEVRGKDGVYSVFNIQQRSIKLSSFQKLANSIRHAPPSSLCNDLEKLEKKYWQSLTSSAPIYGADVGGTFYDQDQTIWNICDLGTILDDLATEYGTKIQGVNTPYLYFGMWKASFAWHTEDMDLYSINYLHFGAPKQWYVIPPAHGRKFEQFTATRFPALARRCPAFMRHKMTIVSPTMLTKQSIPYAKMTQYENEFMITFPYSYHAGFNYGFNCAESTNFALERWIEYGKHSIKCTCRTDMVKISMDPFVYKYQPEFYEDWCRGINLTPHPEDKIQKKLSMCKSREGNGMESLSNAEQLQHQEQIADERYACIFRNLAKFDKQEEYRVEQRYPPLMRAALCRYQFKNKKNASKKSIRLLCLSANVLSRCSFSTVPTFFYGLKQAGKYREQLLDNLWNWQSFDPSAERKLNQWLAQQNPCSICYFFPGNQASSPSKSCFPFAKILAEQSKEILSCAQCHVPVHRGCYENLCLAMNVPLEEDDQAWLCQRCALKSDPEIDDRCTSCLLRGGLLISPEQSERQSFIHGVCSIYQAYQATPSPREESCYYCWSFCPLSYRKISTHLLATCDYAKCSNTFHITCGLLNGCTFNIDQESGLVHARCHLHVRHAQPNGTSISEGKEATLMEVSEILEEDDFIVEEDKRVPSGTRVLIKQAKDHQLGQVLKNEVIYHYSVDFGDDTFSHDMLAEDMLAADPSQLQTGSDVRIRWTDGTLYTCKYLGRKRVLLYHIKLHNEVRQMQRHEFSVDIQPPPSPPPTPCETECEYEPSTKRASQHDKPIIKPKRRRLLICSSSSEDEC